MYSWALGLLLLAASSMLQAQSIWQWEGGLSFSIGQPTNQLGFSFRLKYYVGQVGVAAELGSWYRMTGVGAAGHRWESRVGIGPSFGIDRNGQSENADFNYSRHFQTEIAYLFLRYQEKYTPQFSGRLSADLGDFNLSLENDFLGWRGKDRFRTGTFELVYTRGSNRLALEAALWTGDTHCAEVRRTEDGGARFGLKLIDNCPYGKISHGLLRLKYSARLYPLQQISLSMGIDDERIRHFFQNKLMHDGILRLNKKVKNPHIPMLDESGMPVVDREKQVLRPTRFIWAFEMNRWSIY